MFFGGIIAGIGGALSGAISCVGGFIGSGISAVTSAIGGFASSIGGTLVAGAKSLASGIASIGGKLLGSLSISDVLGGIGKVMGLFTKEDDEDMDDLGCRACQSDKKPEEFKSTEEYINHLKNDIEYDRKKAQAEMDENPVKRYACAAVGATITGNAISEKVGLDLGTKGINALGLIQRAAPYMTASNFTEFLKNLKANGWSDLTAVYEYFAGKGNIDFVKTGKELKGFFSDLNLDPQKSANIMDDIKAEFQKSDVERKAEDEKRGGK